MAYQVLARKWRPKFFASLKGQEHITRALANAIVRGELHHAYLFTGTRGVGKTTIARILAKCLNCEQGITASPCGQCRACTEIDAGRFVDLIEVDAASRTRVEDTRELLDNVQYAPSSGRFKIYLIDEVHMLSGHSFNALLKTLEEPPPHVKFILATTDPERIPITVLSRCLRFSLRMLGIADIVAQLEEILKAENIAYELRALHVLARAAKGSMRDALSLLEQARAYCEGSLQTQAVEEILGVSYQRYLPDLLAAYANSDVKHCLQAIADMAAIGADFTQVLSAILQVLHATAVAQAVPDSESITSFAEVDPEWLTLKDKLAPEEVQLAYQIALMGQKDLAFAPDVRTGFEMTLLRMIVFRPEQPADDSLIQQSSLPKASVATPSSVAPSKPATLLQSAMPPVAPLVQSPVVERQTESREVTPPIEAVPAKTNISVENDIRKDLVDWAQVITKLSLSGLTLMLVKNSIVSKFEGDRLSLTLDASQKACLNPSRQDQIQAALSQYLGRSIKLTIAVGEVNATPMIQAQEQAILREKQAKEAISQDKTVQDIMSTFDATVEKITVI